MLRRIPVIKRAVAEHLESSHRYNPKMPYLTSLGNDDVTFAEPPPDDSPKKQEFDLMQQKCRALFGLGIWLEEVYPQIQMPNNRLCAFFHNPSNVAYKHGQPLDVGLC